MNGTYAKNGRDGNPWSGKADCPPLKIKLSMHDNEVSNYTGAPM